jgi:hypothetical protein
MHVGLRIWMPLVLPFLLAAATVEDDPGACDCDSIDITETEIRNGCPARVKEQTCPLYRQTLIWRERLRQQREQRRLEKQMEPVPVPRFR